MYIVFLTWVRWLRNTFFLRPSLVGVLGACNTISIVWVFGKKFRELSACTYVFHVNTQEPVGSDRY